MPKIQPIRNIIIERIKDNPKARAAIAKIAEAHGRSIDPNNWKELLAFIKEMLTTLLPFILQFIK